MLSKMLFVEYQAKQADGVAPSTSSKIYDILQNNNSDLVFDLGEETEIDNDVDI